MEYEIIVEEDIEENINEHIKCIYCELMHNNILQKEFYELLNIACAFY